MANTKIPVELSSTPSIVDNGDATAITIDSSERVGIGTTSPASILHVKPTSDVNFEVEHSSSNLRLSALNDARSSNVGMQFTSTHFNFLTGNVGIETSTINSGTLGSSNKYLEVAGGSSGGSGTIVLSRATNGNNNEIGGLRYVNTDNADDDGLDADGKLVAIIAARSVTSDSNASDDSGANLTFQTKPEAGNLAEVMRITSDGKLGIGTTAPDEKLQVDGKLKVSSYFGTGTAVIIQNNDSSDNYSAAAFYSGGTLAGYIFVNGSTNATSYVTSSDYRLKENINYEFDALDRVKQLKPARFNFIADADTTVDGFIAHEVSDIVPEAITGEKDGEEMQGIDLSKLVPLLTKAIQEQQTQIEELRQKIETLKN